MSLAPPTRELSAIPANREALHRAVERLLGAPDAPSVAAICETLLSDWHVHARLGWRPLGNNEPPTAPGRLELAEDPQGMRVLVLEPETPLSEPLRERLGWFGRLAGTRLRQQLTAGAPGPEGSAMKVAFSELNQALTGLEVELLGDEGLAYDDWTFRRPAIVDFTGREAGYRYLRAKGNSIEGGTSEVLRNIIAERVLGLPSEPRVDKDVAWKDLPR